MRLALHLLRYGQHARALAALDDLGPAAELPHARLVRALASLAGGEDRRAANIAQGAHATTPKLTLAGFLRADADIKLRPKETEARTAELPRDPRFAAAWAHLVAKMAVARPKDAKKVLHQHAELRPVVPKGSREAKLLAKLAG